MGLEIHLSKTEKALIKLIDKLLANDKQAQNWNRNYPNDQIPLSKVELKLLVPLLINLLESKEFAEKTYFVDNILNSDADNLKEIYLSIRKRYGRARISGSYRWDEFQQRLGTKRSSYPSIKCPPMSREMFLELERLIFLNVNTSDPVLKEIILDLSGQWESFKQETYSKKKIHASTIIPNLLDKIQVSNAPESSLCLDKYNLKAALTLLANVGFMFTTRDLGVAGTISSITGTFLLLKKDKN